MAWAGIIDTTIIGPFFFVGNVTGEAYEELLVDFVLPDLHAKGFDSADVIYMHDGAPAHKTAVVREVLDQKFLGWIGQSDGRRKILDWPARSPDLNPLDFYLWGYLQHRVHLHDDLADTDELEQTVVEESEAIGDVALTRVKRNFVKRLHQCSAENGQLFEHLLK